MMVSLDLSEGVEEATKTFSTVEDDMVAEGKGGEKESHALGRR